MATKPSEVHVPKCFTLETSKEKGVHVVASTEISPHQLILVESPVTQTRASDTPPGVNAEDLGAEAQEWMLAHNLMQEGKDVKWAKTFVHEALKPMTAQHTSIAKKISGSMDTDDFLILFKAVTNNAFALETPLFGVPYGSAFYEKAARFNHSCRPNCISIKLGGNMLIFCGPRRIAKGTELCHSYIPSRLLTGPKATRQQHLFFKDCKCNACQNESAEQRAEYEKLGFPAGHAKTEDGKNVVMFKYAASIANMDNMILFGNKIFKSMFKFLLEHPIAGAEIAEMYVQAAFAHMTPENAGVVMFRAATQLLSDCYSKLVKLKLFKEHSGVAILNDISSVLLYLGSGDLRAVTTPKLIEGMQGLGRYHGGTFDCFRDDVQMLSQVEHNFAKPTIGFILAGMEKSIVENAESFDVEGLDIDVCGNPKCPKDKSSFTKGCLKKCARCIRVAYCTQECQKEGWKLEHKCSCSPKAK